MSRLRLGGVLVACAFVLALPARAAATTINFAGLLAGGTPQPYGTSNLRSYGTSLDVGGLTFTTTNNLSYGLSVWEENDPYHPVGGAPTTSLFEYAAGFTMTIARTGGGAFGLNGIDLANWGVYASNFPGTFGVTFTGTKSDSSTVTQTFTVSNSGPSGASPVLQSFVFSGFTDLASVSMTQGTYTLGNAFQFNNLVVEGIAQTSVPEPGSVVLVASGLMALLRRRMAFTRR